MKILHRCFLALLGVACCLIFVLNVQQTAEIWARIHGVCIIGCSLIVEFQVLVMVAQKYD
jgi:hypothetical protein